MKTTTKKCLFGGALFAAGLATTSAHAQFAIDNAYSFTRVFVQDLGAAGVEIDNYTYGPSITSETFAYAGISGNGTATLSNTALTAALNVTGTNGYAFATSYALVTVGGPTDILATWDFLTTAALTYSDLQVFDVTNNVSLLNAAPNTAGSQMLTLQPGIDYVLIVSADSDAPADISGSITIIPAPGAFALLGLAGITSRRRRRQR